MKEEIKYKIIKSLGQYTQYCNIHEQLVQEDEGKYLDEIELLELLIEDYDQRIQGEKTNSLNPVELLRHLMKESNLSQTNLAREIDVSPQLISDVLAYRRNISKDMVVKLATHFAMQQEAFSRPYSLTNDQKSKAKG